MRKKKTKDNTLLGAAVTEALKKIYPEAKCALEAGGDPFRLLVMARLSAQCTDKRVNLVCRELFRLYPDAEAMAAASVEEIGEQIRSCGLYRMKARDLRAMSEMLLSEYGGEVPSDMEALLALPGVGRKIANLMRGDVFGLPAVVTDTHCIRICGRLGFYEEALKEPYKVERILAEAIKPEEQSDFCHRIVMFGRDTCSARAPKCGECPLSGLCRHYSENKQGNHTEKNKKEASS